jgi:multicomponent Na+:H+ antiporter subunit D
MSGALAAIPPGLILILAGVLLIPLREGGLRAAVMLAAPLLALVLVLLLPEGEPLRLGWLGQTLVPLRVDGLSRLFGIVFSIAAFAGGLFALGQPSRTEPPAAYLYCGAALGAVFAGDLLTLFLCWEAMALASAVVILAGGARASGAGMRYLAIHLLGGVLLMAGIAGHAAETGSIAFNAIGTGSPAGWLILAGFLVNAGAPPLSAWIGDAYPEASWSGTVFLSAFTTKTAVYVLVRGFPGEPLLLWLGLVMIFYGIVYAILENDMRRILAYSIVNQVGFMVAAIGIGTPMALAGACAHAFAHIIYKALLLMSAGSVLRMTGRRKCTELGGLYRTMPVTTACGIVGALAISAFPLTSGFVAKSIISDAVPFGPVYLLLAAASAGVFLHAGIKFPWFVFFNRDAGLRVPDPPASMRAAMLLLAGLSVLIGLAPAAFYRLLPFPVDYRPYTGEHVVYQLQLLLFSGLAFFMMLPLLRRSETITLDVDWLWRGLPRRLAAPMRGLAGQMHRLAGRRRLAAERAMTALERQQQHGGLLARNWPTGSIALWAAALLAAWLLLYYF